MAKPETLKRILDSSGTPAEIIGKINDGFVDIVDKSPKKQKAKYLFHAVSIMDAELDGSARQKIMEACACTIGGSVQKKAEWFAKRTKGLDLKERIKLLGELKHFGNPVLQKDGTIQITLKAADNGVYRCSCPQISTVEIPTPGSFTYCMCCVGHFRRQYEKALSANVEVTQISSPLESAGAMPCAFVISLQQKRTDGE